MALLHKRGLWFKGVGAALIAALVVAIAPSAAWAGTASGSWGHYGPYAGYNYRNQSTITTNVPQAFANTIVEPTSGGSAPAGYMGALARMYKSSKDALCSQRGYSYNPGSAIGWHVPTSQTSCGAGAYYSFGVSQAWTGFAYQSVFTFRSPNQNQS